MLEASQYEDNTFVTLTYSDEKIPSDKSVRPIVLSDFIRKLRRQTGLKLRYFGCGEYGDDTFRPHYHIALFNYPNCYRTVTRQRRGGFDCCPVCNQIYHTWGNGGISLGLLEPQSAAYVAGYVTKKMTKDDDPRLEGRRPEFARMSLRPGIGLGMMHELASTLLETGLDEKMIDVPTSLQHGRKKLPLGRYLRKKLRTFIGRDEKTPQAILDAQKEELRPLRETAFANSTPFREEILKKSEGRRIQIEAREHRNRKKGTI